MFDETATKLMAIYFHVKNQVDEPYCIRTLLTKNNSKFFSDDKNGHSISGKLFTDFNYVGDECAPYATWI